MQSDATPAAGPIYIGELAPPEIRGMIMSFWQMFYSVGSFIAYWVNYASQEHVTRLGEWDWRMVVIWQLLMPILIVAQLPFIPETPRWYIKHDKVENARASLRRVRDSEQEIENEVLMIREALEFEKEAISSNYSALWKDKSVRRRLWIAFVLNAGQQITGQGTLNTYSTIVSLSVYAFCITCMLIVVQIYKKVFTSSATIALINALNATFGIIFTMNATWTVDRYGRKFLFIVGAIGMAVCMLCVALVGIETPNLAGDTKSRPVAISMVFLLFLFAFFYKPSWGKRSPIPFVAVWRSPLTYFCRSNDLDLDLRSLLHERPRPSRRHGFPNPKHRKLHRPTILPHLPRQQRLLHLLPLLRCQPLSRRLRNLRRARNSPHLAGGNRRPVWWHEPC